jgi:hypothetical protein
MQIGNTELDNLYEQCIVPAIEACGLQAIRVDRDNQGDLLKQEIREFIEQADIIIADLTNERPNCYLEIGYAMGIDKFKNLILTVREDHYHRHPNYRPDGPTIHFDASGYDMVFWSASEAENFRTRLEEKIRRRLLIITPNIASSQTSLPLWDTAWIEGNQQTALAGLQRAGFSACTEILFSIVGQKPAIPHRELLDACRASQIDTFGWPIGVVLDSPMQDDWKPRPTSDGVYAEVSCPPDDGNAHYDFWYIKKNADYYTLSSLFEDTRAQNKIFFNSRIVRTAEALLFCARLYNNLGIPNSRTVNIQITYSGLAGRHLSASGTRSVFMSTHDASFENQISHTVTVRLAQIEDDIVNLVKEFTAPLFGLFGFASFGDNIYSDIVNNFIAGRVT